MDEHGGLLLSEMSRSQEDKYDSTYMRQLVIKLIQPESRRGFQGLGRLGKWGVSVYWVQSFIFAR